MQDVKWSPLVCIHENTSWCLHNSDLNPLITSTDNDRYAQEIPSRAIL